MSGTDWWAPAWARLSRCARGAIAGGVALHMVGTLGASRLTISPGRTTVTAAPDCVLERHNVIDVPACQDTVRAMRNRMFDGLEATGGMRIPMRRGDWQATERKLP